MKKLLGILVLGLLLSGNAYAKNITILFSNEKEVALLSKQTPLSDKVYHRANAAGVEHCKKYKKYAFRSSIGMRKKEIEKYYKSKGYKIGKGFSKKPQLLYYVCSKIALNYLPSWASYDAGNKVDFNNYGDRSVAILIQEEDKKKIVEQPKKKKPKKEKPKEDLRYALLKYGLKIDNDKFVFKFNKDNSGLLKSKMHVWEELYKPDKGAFGGDYKEEIIEDKIFWTIENESKFSFRKIGGYETNFVVLDFKNRLAKVKFNKSDFKGKISTQEIVKVGIKEKQIVKKPKEKIAVSTDIDTSLITIGSGSGFYINRQGYALTNNHVISICKQTVVIIDGKETLFRVIATDKTNDIAVIKTDFRPSNFIKINPDGAKLGESVIAVGYPLAGRLSDSVKITKGIVSSLTGINNNIGQIQIDAALQPGNSGGPVLNEDATLVGMASAGLNKLLMAKEARYIPENVNFAVASPIIVNVLKNKKIKYSTPSIFGGSYTTTELAEMGNQSTVQLFCRNTREAYVKLKRSKKYSQVLLDLD